MSDKQVIVDIGINLGSAKYKGYHKDLLDHAYFEYIEALISISNSRSEWDVNLDLIDKFKDHKVKLFCTVGVHPHDAKSIYHLNDDVLVKEKKLNEFKELLLRYHGYQKDSSSTNPVIPANPVNLPSSTSSTSVTSSRSTSATSATSSKVVAVGECGLDYNRMFSPKEVQIEVFKVHIEVAAMLDKPLYIHERDAGPDMVRLLTEAKKQYPNLKGVIHCFTGKNSIMQEYLKLGFYIGITGWVCDDRRNGDLLTSVKALPLNRLMIETDGPFLTPPAYVKRFNTSRNESDSLSYIVERISKEKGCTVETVRKMSYANTKTLFQI